MPSQTPDTRRAIIDVGSNSVRLVIYEGPARTPFEVHNEKIQARLGRSLAETGAIDAEAYDRALEACRRFRALLDATGIADVRTVATAAARDAANGPQFMADLAAIGLRPELLSGEAEAAGSAAGVLSAFPGARGVVGDLGGGSLELVPLDRQGIGKGSSFALGVLRVPALRKNGDKAFAAEVRTMLREVGWRRAKDVRELYLVGGSWRALGHLDMHLTGSPLPGVHGYAFPLARLRALRKAIAELDVRELRAVPGMTNSRIATLDDAALLLEAVGSVLHTELAVVSGFGLREGLLYQALSPAARAEDPLLAATGDYLDRRGNPRWDGEGVNAWIAGCFADDRRAEIRIRRAACDLAGADLHPLTETRARHGMELAWLGGWVGITAKDRAMLSQAIWTAWGGKGDCEIVAGILGTVDTSRARAWGEAIRLADRLSGGVSRVLAHARLAVDERRQPVLEFGSSAAGLGSGVVKKQLAQLAQALGALARGSDPT